MSKAHLTAISRKSPSAPMKYLSKMGLLKGKMLDYGCGRGFDADFFGMEKYDPHFFRCDDFSPCEFDTITCNYVLNVIENPNERKRIIDEMLHWLKPDGNLYIAVRADKKALNGYTSKGTWQGYIELPYTKIQSTSAFDLYHLTK
jgi:2-polyprenyl-3-methyl-5-hydroxy-6-metoxy-1,4-benzoquinol methylase